MHNYSIFMANTNMNYLAHIFLSGDNEKIRIGNFMADDVKGSKYQAYPDDIQIGILLHRRIDWFTDQDLTARKSKRRLHDRYGLYRGVIIDIFYDHMLAANWSEYCIDPLSDYAQEFYASLRDNKEFLTPKVRNVSRYMIQNDWLTSYADIAGIRQVLEGMNRRTGGKGMLDLAIEDLLAEYDGFEEDFRHFFKKLRTFSVENLDQLHEQYSN